MHKLSSLFVLRGRIAAGHYLSARSSTQGTQTGRISLVALVALLFVSLNLVTLNVEAQSTDLEPPTIVLEEIEQGFVGEVQIFTAQVSDDQRISTVVLFHRLAGDDNYMSVDMLPVAGSSVYSASVSHSTDDPRDIEYYIQAEDFGGNKAIRGFAFDPLVRVMSVDVVAVAATTPTPGFSRNRKLLWGAIGIVALVVLASQVGGGGGSSSNDNPTTTNVPVDIEVNPVPTGFTF